MIRLPSPVWERAERWESGRAQLLRAFHFSTMYSCRSATDGSQTPPCCLCDDPLLRSIDPVQVRATAESELSPSLRSFQSELGVENLDVPLAQEAVGGLQRCDFRLMQLLRQPACKVQLTAAPLAR